MSKTLLKCAICGHTEEHWLGDHIAEAHGITVDSYIAKYPGSPLASKALTERNDALKTNVRRGHPPTPEELKVTIGGIEFKVNAGVPASACLPMPGYYRSPKYGELAQDVSNVLVSLLMLRSIYVWGPPGTGKDALFHAWSALTRTPALLKGVIPGTDIEAWFFSRGFNEKGTHWEEGEVLKALRDGYLCEDGTVVPYMLLISDLDRADRSQAEYLRLITDTIKGRISGPAGHIYDVLPGTRIVATANTPGGGDTTGRMVSSNPLDGALLNRIDRFYQFHNMDWKDEGLIVKAKFPSLAGIAPGIFAQMGRITLALRKAIEGGELYADFSHRSVCNILGHASDLYECSNKKGTPKTLLAKGARCWLDSLPDKETKMSALKLMAPHIPGGIGGVGTTGPKAGSHLPTF